MKQSMESLENIKANANAIFKLRCISTDLSKMLVRSNNSMSGLVLTEQQRQILSNAEQSIYELIVSMGGDPS